MTEVSVSVLLDKAREEVIKRSARILKSMTTGETVDKEELLELKKLKAEIKFIEKTQAEMNGGKPEKVVPHMPQNVIDSLKSIQTTVGEIVQSMT